MNLVIVESPAKAKTIKKFLGEGFEVESSYGHITDLPKKGMGIDLTTFQPNYEVSEDKKEVVKKLKLLAKKAEIVWLASDEDREGEAIAWHLYNELNLKKDKTKRIVFHEITKNAIQKAVQNPRDININLVDAQQARRVLDRIVGFEMSPILWTKIKTGLSAGRVQSVAVRLICERENEIQTFETQTSYRIFADFLNSNKNSLKSRLNIDFEDYDKTLKFVENVKGKEFNVLNIEKKPSKRTPSAPFITSTLQQEAASKLGFSVSRTMRLSQDLYEAGHITYMRTDSTNLSQEAIDNAKKTITEQFGTEYSQTRQFVTKNKNAQEAHEAIRPTNFDLKVAGADEAQKKLYQLIWKKTLASQMSDAKLEKTNIEIGTSSIKEKFIASGEVILFDGFLKLYQIDRDEDSEEEEDDKLLPKVNVGEKLDLETLTGIQKYSRPAARYSESTLVRKLEELGIGRPSTYAPTISTIQKREYVEIRDLESKQRDIKKIILSKEKIEEKIEEENYGVDRRKLFPTDIGLIVNQFLTEHFPEILDFGFTARVEESFDKIAGGGEDWKKIMNVFYEKFHPVVEEVKDKAERVKGERLLGIDPESGKNIYARIGRYGAMVQIGEVEDEEKPKFAGLMKGQQIGTITLEEALKLFELPRYIGNYEDKKVEVNIGRFGPYVKHDGKFVSLKPKEGDEVFSVDLERAVQLIEDKREADKNKFIKSFEEEDPIIEVLNGKWGPYIKQGKENYKIPKTADAAKLTLEDCKKLIEESATTPKTKTKRKTTKK